MKNFILSISSLAVVIFAATSCGGDESTSSNSNLESNEASVNDGYDFSNAEEAIETYTEMMSEYEDLLAQGNAEAAEKYLKSMQSLENYVTSKFSNQAEILQNLNDMSKDIKGLQSEYLNKAKDLLNDMEDIPGASDVKKSIKDAQNEVNSKMKDAQKQMNDAMKGLGERNF